VPDWESLHHLATLARVRTLAGAARVLNVEHATVARRIAALEVELDLKLLDRRGRKIELTRNALELLASLEQMQTEAEAIERIAAGKRASITGEVTISAPPGLATAMLAPPIVALRRSHPGLTLQILAETRQRALQRREADLAIRLGAPVDRDLTATRLGDVSFRLYASAAYLAETPDAKRAFIAYDASMDSAPQQLALARIARNRPIAIRTNSAELQVSLACAGGGVAMLPDFMAAGEPIVPTGSDVVRREAWLVIHSDMTGSAPVCVVAETIGHDLRARLERMPA
jgi:DNA-binding transcriptional LysR family regulator